ncbi:MAG: Xaa-Pro peptidase family protein [Kiritimatiellaeota bacterium]|nr:Xaa-Pro peptidase family protein [Kiritimatiellota bacterium]
MRRQMQSQKVDALLLTSEINLRYVAGGPLTELFLDKHNTFFCILPADDSIGPALIMSSGREGPAQASWIKDRRFWGYGKTGSIMDQSEWLKLVSSTLAEKGLSNGTIGIELDNGQRIGLTISNFNQLREALPNVKFRSSAPVVQPVMAIKSELEIAKIRKSCHITCAAFQKALSALYTGMSEKEAASIVRSEMFRRGATGQGFLALFGGPRGIWADAIACDYKFKQGDMIMFDGGCCVDGYFADVSRMAWMGEPPTQDRNWYELARQANASALSVIRPGVTMRAVHAAGQRPFRENGAGDLLVFGGGQLGHGFGLTVHELPDISATSEETFQPGMVIAVEPAIANTPNWAKSQRFFIVENNIVITETGYEMLTPMSDELFVVEK